MAQTVGDVMTRNPVTIEANEPVGEAARRMREADTGAIVVLDDGRINGIITDRDITVRLVANDRDSGTSVREVASTADVETVGPDASIEQVVQLMRTRAIRRLPVVENGAAVGIVSIGDLAIERDSDSALADISAAEPNT